MGNNIRSSSILFFILFLVMVGFGIIIPVMPFFLTSMGGDASILGLFMAIYSLMHLLFAPFWGRLSDRIGRRPVILIGLSGYGITFILFGFTDQLWMMFAVRILSGAISSATLPTALAYMADITGEDERSQGIGLMAAAMGLGMIVGPALGGWLGQQGFSLPFFVAGGLALLIWPFALFYLPETLIPAKSIPENITPNPASMEINNPLFLLFILVLILNFSTTMFEATFVYFAARRAAFGPREIGFVFTILGVIGVVIQGGLIGRLAKRFGDMNLMKGGLLISAAGLVLILFASDMLSLLLTSAVYNIGTSLIGPSSSSLVTRYSKQNQGTSLGVMQSFGSLGRIAGPVAGGILYEFNILIPYLTGALILVIVYLTIKANLQILALPEAGEGTK
ncbi:MAG: MFS transporter [Syntrophomonadaceae bacterium]|nr:MFS transporter [Syntrophomonadaceae bacterium]MDD3271367.1 MFS transporter [Syntrophomonadaceae bacterium]MDD3899192.1 MFS transporter [Syntrophomonadaceae bacterium]